MDRELSTTLVRLDASPYQAKDFFNKEEEIARRLGLNYLFCDFRHQGVSERLKKLSKDNLILISNTHTPVETIPAEFLERTLLWLHPNSGYDNFSPNWLKKQKFPIILGNSIRAPGVSEYILASLFSHFAKKEHQKEWDKDRKWPRKLIHDSRISIVGMGQIGQRIAKSLAPLCQQINCFDPYQNIDHYYKENFETLASHSDVIILCASLNSKNHHMINQDFLKKLPHDFLLINSARGPLLDQQSLVKILEERPHAYAFLDVFESEPFRANEFEDISNIHLSSHIAGVSKNIEERILNFVESTLESFLNKPKDDFLKTHQYTLLSERLVSGELI